MATIPKFIHEALGQCLEAGTVPSIRDGQGGNSHSAWIIEFKLFDGKRYHSFQSNVVSSYGQQFLEFSPLSGPGFVRNFSRFRSMTDILALAKQQIDQVA